MAIECVRKTVPTVRYEGVCTNCKAGFKANEGDLYFINKYHKESGNAQQTNCLECKDGGIDWSCIGKVWATEPREINYREGGLG